jgi:CMP/dCMP kinase
MFFVDEKFNIGIDGKSATGKDTVTKILFYVLNHLPGENNHGWKVFDSSAMYRAVSLFMQEEYNILGIKQISVLDPLTPLSSLDDSELEKIVGVVKNISLETVFSKKADVFYNNERQIKKTYSHINLQRVEVGTYAGILGRIDPVRPILANLERGVIQSGYCIVPGRDSFTVVLQEVKEVAPLGLYIYANIETRAQRRLAECRGNGETLTYEQVLDALKKRDNLDLGRTTAPLPPNIEQANQVGYKSIDTSNLTRYQMGVESVNLIIPDMKIELTPNEINNLVKQACNFYKIA